MIIRLAKKTSVFLGVIIFLTSTVNAQESVKVWDIESGELRGMYCSGNCPQAVSSVSHPVRSGRYSMRTYLHRQTLPTSYRTEVVMKRDPNSAALVSGSRFNFTMDEYWIGLSIYIPSNFVVDQAGKTDTLFQVHQSSGTADSIPPPFALRINESNWNIASRWSGGSSQIDNPLGNSIGSWTDWVIHAKWSDGASGLLQVWRDSKLIVNRNGPNQYNGETAPYPKMGLYKSVWKPGSPATNTDWRLFYHDELRIGGASASYAAVAPPGSAPSSSGTPPPPSSTSTPTPTKVPTKIPTLTKSPTPTPSTALPGDIDRDGDVDIFDYNLLVENIGSTDCGNVADIDANCKVDIFDYNILIENFGKKI